MTTNERLYHLGIIGKWDDAVKRRDRVAMIKLLEQAEVPKPDLVADTVLANPQKYGH